jgi:hypothetical protein
MKALKSKILLEAFVLLIMCIPLVVDGQIITGSRNLRVGEIWHHDDHEANGVWEQGYVWPGNVWYESSAITRLSNACSRQSDLFVGARNWEHISGTLFPAFVGGPLVKGLNLKVVLRRIPPTTIVDGEAQVPRQAYDEIDPDLISDAMLLIRFSYEIGLTAEMRWYAYAGKNADSYFMLDIVLLNNGNAFGDERRLEYRDQILHDVHSVYTIQEFISQDGATEYKAIWEDGADDWVEYYGENYLDYIGSGTPLLPNGDPAADSLRLFIFWDGDHNHGNPGPQFDVDDTGDPALGIPSPLTPLALGQFFSQQYVGMGILHADKSADDESNDLSQPFSTVWRPQTIGFSSDEEQYDFLFSGNHMDSPQEMGFTTPGDPSTVARPIAYQGVGPYEMPYNSDVHIVMLIAINGLSRAKCAEYGRQWWEQRQGGEGISDMEKNALIATGRDSLFKVYSAATRRYFRNIENGRDPFDVPDPPPAPDLTVTAAEKAVLLEWSDVSGEPDPDTEVNDFAGYRVYRALGRNDTTYTRIWEGNSTSYRDTTVQRGVEYFYYVTAYDNGSQNWDQPGVSLESGRYWNMMDRNSPTVVSVDGEKTVMPLTYELNNNYPNPFNLSTIINYGLPVSNHVLLEIYNTLGQKVRTLVDRYLKAGVYNTTWDATDDYGNVVPSGVYFYKMQASQYTSAKKMILLK